MDIKSHNIPLKKGTHINSYINTMFEHGKLIYFVIYITNSYI